jgi:hypothetical protein
MWRVLKWVGKQQKEFSLKVDKRELKTDGKRTTPRVTIQRTTIW